MELPLFAPAASARNQQLLADGNWQQTDYYLLDGKDELWQHAAYLTQSKQLTALPEEALVYLMQRLLLEEEWKETSQQALKVEEVVRYLTRFAGLDTWAGHDLPLAEFWESFAEIMAGIIRNPASTYRKNGQPVAKSPLLAQANVLSVACFANRWNRRLYFVETPTQWALVDWGTSV